jgi:hypothetical protein
VWIEPVTAHVMITFLLAPAATFASRSKYGDDYW